MSVRLVYPHEPEEVVFNGEKVEQYLVAPPAQATDAGTSHGVEDEMVCRGDNGNQDAERIEEADKETQHAMAGG